MRAAADVVKVRLSDLTVGELHVLGRMGNDDDTAIEGASEPLQRSDYPTLVVGFTFAAFALVFNLVERIEKKPYDTISNDRITGSIDEPFDRRLLALLTRILIDEHEHLF